MAASNFIDKLGNEGRQNIQFELSTKEIIYFTFYWCSSVNYWYMDIEYKEFTLKGLQVVYSDNLLEQYKRILPFGIQVDSTSGLSPITQNAFSDGINRVIVNEY